jgi:hypothetical protein
MAWQAALLVRMARQQVGSHWKLEVDSSLDVAEGPHELGSAGAVVRLGWGGGRAQQQRHGHLRGHGRAECSLGSAECQVASWASAKQCCAPPAGQPCSTVERC